MKKLLILVSVLLMSGCFQTEELKQGQEAQDELPTIEPQRSLSPSKESPPESQEKIDTKTEPIPVIDPPEEPEEIPDVASYKEDDPLYTTYSSQLYNELKGKEPFVLSFHADWCPTCRGIDKNINAELSSFPKGTKILKVNYDTERELKRQYNIAVQSTLVVIDAEGEAQVTLAAPGNAEIKKAIEASL